MATEVNKPEVLKAAMEHANNAETAIRQFRGEIDRVAYQFDVTDRAGLIEAADEASKVLVRVFKMQNEIREVAVGTKKAK